MGTQTFIIGIYVIMAILFVTCIRPRRHKRKIYELIYKKSKYYVFWGFIIVICYGGYFELLISSFLNL